ncbi:phosphate transporter [Irineochytrium annulatum]|nr:phosphate transporter [Irineochytrium annulatum]
MSAPVASQKRAQAFAHLDEAKLGWFHLRAVLVSGVGFFTDAYDIFVISQALSMIYQVYYTSEITGGFNSTDGVYTAYNGSNFLLSFNGAKGQPNNKFYDAALKASTNWGNLFGQLGFGYLGDKLGRKKMYGVELIIMIVCTLGSAFSAPAARGFNVLTILAIWRFFLGIGIGGDYPMSAIITSEFANVRYRGMMLAAVFAMQGIGILVGGVVFVSTLTYMKPYIDADFMNLDYVWRIALGAGVIPGLLAIYFRLTIPETPRYTVDVIGDTDKAERDVEKVLAMNEVRDVTSNWGQEGVAATKVVVKNNDAKDFFQYFGKWSNAKVLFGTAYTWFVLDVAFYGISLNNSVILNMINFNGPAKVASAKGPATPPHDIWDSFYQIAIGNIIIACCGQVPGYWFTVALVEKLGRKPIAYIGWVVLTIILAVLAATWNTTTNSTNLSNTTFITLFTIAQFFFQFGPNSTTFIVPGEVFPTRWRSTCHGFSAACGKAGAILGIQAVGPYFTSNAQIVLIVFAVGCASGGFVNILIPETKGKTLEELSMEDDVVVDEVHIESVEIKA